MAHAGTESTVNETRINTFMAQVYLLMLRASRREK